MFFLNDGLLLHSSRIGRGWGDQGPLWIVFTSAVEGTRIPLDESRVRRK